MLMEAAPLDKTSIRQTLLDIEKRVRTNPFPWRGQFSPQLVEILLSSCAKKGTFILDPFAGAGTTLFESARKNLPCLGTEINPAAVAMAETVCFVNVTRETRLSKLREAWTMISRRLANAPEKDLQTGLVRLARDCQDDKLMRNIFVNCLIRFCEAKETNFGNLKRAFSQHELATIGLPFTLTRCEIKMQDARTIPLPESSVDLVITSPPYINVFNYHQNNRRAMELLGWELLVIAKSEFGSNRKHRGNRFLTVIQYCMDMAETFQELRRVAKPDAKLVFVVGRESTVRGVSFKNGSIVTSVAVLCGFRLSLRQERKFTNVFGKLIYEDILHFTPVPSATVLREAEVRNVGRQALAQGLNECAKPEVSEGITEAIESAQNVQPSPKLKLG